MLGLLALGLASVAAPPPWDVWSDLARLAVVAPGDQVLLRSSHCPSGCRYDRTESGDTRFLRLEGDEQVVFEETGAGAIVRIWLTHGDGPTSGFESDVRLRVRMDGETAPRLDVPIGDLFNGRRPPFLPPLVADRAQSSGGYVSYVPLPYRRGVKVSLSGALDRRIWFQFTFHRLADAAPVVSWRGDEDLSGLVGLLSARGRDPWGAGAGTFEQRRLELAPGQDEVLRAWDTPGTVTGLRLRLPATAWTTTRLRLVTDDALRADLPVADFFGATPAPGMRSALLGRDDDDTLYSWLPMPVTRGAAIRLANTGTEAVSVWYEVRRRTGPPLAGSRPLSARALRSNETAIGVDIPLLTVGGAGRWVGLFADLHSVGYDAGEYLEGDERVYLDGSPHPALYGTGVEDLFGGGFYFERGPFRLATHGSPSHEVLPDGEDHRSMYRLFLTDAIPFAAGLRAGLEGGPTGNLALRARRVAWFYADDAPLLERLATVDVGDAGSRLAAAYQVEGREACGLREGAFEGEPERSLTYTACERRGGASRFTVTVPRAASLRLRRRMDATAGEQRATVMANGAVVGAFPAVEPNAFRSLRDIDLDLPGRHPGGPVRVTIVPDEGAPFTEVRWELWASPEAR